jgi:predicted RNA-binding Zn-ribbon protein involved in translation (DUF1610 family)
VTLCKHVTYYGPQSGDVTLCKHVTYYGPQSGDVTLSKHVTYYCPQSGDVTLSKHVTYYCPQSGDVALSKHVTCYGPQSGFLFYNRITSIKKTSLSTTRGITEQFCGFDPWEPSSVSSMSNGILAHACSMSE